MTLQCYGPYEARNEPCKATNTTSQCPSGAGAAKFYHAKTAYSIAAKNVSWTYLEIKDFKKEFSEKILSWPQKHPNQ